MTREERLERLLLEVVATPHLSVDPAWVKKVEAAITDAPEPVRWKCPACQSELPPPNLGICDPCKGAEWAQESHRGES
jgi:hypothetical protein